MFILRLVGLLVAIGIGASLFAYMFSGNRRYLGYAWLLFRAALMVVLVFLVLMALERVLAPLV
ncbi:MAG: hypothetical protein HGA47_16245 [Zoogloea sp.]|nr:hypothetical protein [Zoogloea sp.]